MTTPHSSGAGSFDIRSICPMSLGFGRSLPVRGDNNAAPQPPVLSGAGRRRPLQQQTDVENFNGLTPLWRQLLRPRGHFRAAGDPEQQPFVQQRPCCDPAAACRPLLLALAHGSPSSNSPPWVSSFNPGSSTTTLPAPCGASSAGRGRGAGCCARPLAMAMATAIGTPTPTPTFTPHEISHAPRNTTVIG